MREKEVIYMNRTISNTKRQDKRQATCKTRERPWKIIAASLGILCLFLLMSTMGLGYMCEYQGYTFLMGADVKFIIKVSQCSSGSKIEDKEHRCEINTSLPAIEDHSVLPPKGEKDCEIYEGKWSCHENNCYYFSTEEKTWDESKRSCQQRGSNLIKIDDEVEQRFIQSKIKYSYWVGLYKNGTNQRWMWQDGTNPSWKLNFLLTTSNSDAVCGLQKNTNIINAFCTKEFYYICKK